MYSSLWELYFARPGISGDGISDARAAMRLYLKEPERAEPNLHCQIRLICPCCEHCLSEEEGEGERGWHVGERG